jgi:hypothetical protein
MRVLVAFIVLTISLSLSGCCRPHQAAYAKPLPSSWENPQSQPSPPKRTKASSAKPPQSVSKIPQPTKASSVKLPKPVSRVPTKATSAVPAPSPPQRKPEQPPTNASVPSLEGSGTVEQETEAKFKAAEAKAKREGVHSLTNEDIEGLSDEQIKQLRGY